MLPLVQTTAGAGVVLPGDRLRVGGDAAALDAAADLIGRAFGIQLIAVAPGEAADVVVVRGAVEAADPIGADPRPEGRAGVAEAYTIRTDGDRVILTGVGDEALFRGLITVAAYVSVGAAVPDIDDAPRFAWRGLSLDVVRRWYPADEVRRIVDLLALHKLNVLHLHLTDMQAWRFAVPEYPALTPDDAHYTADDLDGLVAYARERHVTLIPELDLPGHVAPTVDEQIGVTVSAGPHPMIRYVEWGAPGVERLVRAAFTELAVRFDASYLHIGGDEAFGDPHESYIAFVAAAADVVHDLGRRVIGWQETSRADALGESDLGQLWIAERDRFDADKAYVEMPEAYHPFIPILAEVFAESAGDPARLGSAGVPAIISSSDPLYLDRKPLESSADPDQAGLMDRLGFPNYQRTSSTDVLRWDPFTQADIVAGGVTVAGIEAALWCETVRSFDDAAALLLPRLSLVAQRAWGGVEPVDVAAVTAAARDSAAAWTRLGFGAYYRSSEVFS